MLVCKRMGDACFNKGTTQGMVSRGDYDVDCLRKGSMESNSCGGYMVFMEGEELGGSLKMLHRIYVLCRTN